jgi:acyl carrier protein
MNQGTGMTEAQILDRTRAWVRENFLYASPDWVLHDEDPMLGSGVIDSVGVIELVEFLQQTFSVKIPDVEITERNVGSLAAVGRFVYAKCHANQSGAGTRSPQPA